MNNETILLNEHYKYLSDYYLSYLQIVYLIKVLLDGRNNCEIMQVKFNNCSSNKELVRNKVMELIFMDYLEI